MDHKCTNKDMDENPEWLTQNTEDPKSNKGNLTFSTHIVNVIELYSNKKVANPPFSTSTSPFQVYPPFLAKNFVVIQFSEGPTAPRPPPLIRGRGRVLTMPL